MQNIFLKNKYIIIYSIFIILVIAACIFYMLFFNKNKINASLNLQKSYKIETLNLNDITNNALFIKNKESKLFSISLIFKGGSAQEPIGKEGASKVLETMMLQRAGNIPSSKFEELLQEYSLNLNISATNDYVILNITSLTKYKEKAFEILNLVLNHPNFGSNELNYVKRNLILEANLSNHYTSIVANNELTIAAFGKTYYTRNSIGTPKSIASITETDLYNLKNKLFTKNNVIIGSSGSINKEELENNLKNILSKLPNGNTISYKPENFVPKINGIKEINLNVLGSSNTDILIAMKSPPLKTKDYYTSLLVNNYLGGGILNSLLMQKVRIEQGLVYTINSYLKSSLYGDLWVISATSTDTKAKQTVSAIKNTLGDLLNGKYSSKDLEKSRKWLEGNYLFNFTTNGDRALNLAYMQLKGYSVKDIYERNLIISKINNKDIKDFIKRYVNPNNIIIITAGSKK